MKQALMVIVEGVLPQVVHENKTVGDNIKSLLKDVHHITDSTFCKASKRNQNQQPEKHSNIFRVQVIKIVSQNTAYLHSVKHG